MNSDDSSSRSTFDRWAVIFLGILLLLISSPVNIFATLIAWVAIRDGGLEIESFITMIVAFAIGLFCAWTSIKMVFNLKRRDGGLLSPFVLRLGGLLFSIAPFLHISELLRKEGSSHSSLWLIWQTVACIVIACGCFILAKHRQLSANGHTSV